MTAVRTAADSRLPTLDALRGIAAFAVAWFHFTWGTPEFLAPGLLKSSGAWGWMGVEVFFVISGFVIPFALARSGYTIDRFGVFLGRRLVRLDPPYLVSIVVVLVLAWLSAMTPGYRGAPFEFSWLRLLVHLGYLNVVVGQEWYNPVFWTLAVEFQYYLLIGLLFPLIASVDARVRYAAMTGLGALAFLLPSEHFLPRYLFAFLLGIWTFHLHRGFVSRAPYLAGTLALGAGAWLTLGGVVAAVTVASALLIAFVQIRVRALSWLGMISYSLYLLHVPIGGRVINLSLRLGDSLGVRIGALLLASAASILASYVFYRLVELPAHRWAARIALVRRARDGEGDAASSPDALAPRVTAPTSLG